MLEEIAAEIDLHIALEHIPALADGALQTLYREELRVRRRGRIEDLRSEEPRIAPFEEGSEDIVGRRNGDTARLPVEAQADLVEVLQ